MSDGHPSRRKSDRPGLPVVIEGAAAEPPRSRGRRTLADFAAQLLGQEGKRRGLRGGPETLDAARESYLRTEYSGPADRRPKAGRITRTEI
jgi:hypothetical protein